MSYDKSNITFAPMPTNRKFINLNGRTFDRWAVLGFAGIKQGLSRWFCECECGTIAVVGTSPLRSGKSQSCGCNRPEATRSANVRHGQSGSPEFHAFAGAKDRCTNPNYRGFHRYGGRGIEFRFESFEEWYTELGPRPTPTHSVDRINNDGHYEPGNVRWATHREQWLNKSGTVFLSHNGQTLPLQDWSGITGLQEFTIYNRVKLRRWCIPCSLTLPVRGRCPHREGVRLKTDPIFM